MFQNTAEQTAIIETVLEDRRNLLITALAGCAKTTTLQLIAEALPNEDILAIAFNKDIVNSMKAKMPPNVNVLTINAIGHRAIGAYLRKKMNLDKGKMYALLKQACDQMGADDEFMKERFATVLSSVNMAKQMGYMPESPEKRWRPLISEDEFFSDLDEIHEQFERDMIDRVLVKSYEMSLNGYIDFGDQILLPAILNLPMPSPSLTLVDEAQDLSIVNHYVLAKIVRNRRIIAVGDSCQAIYAFRGADENSMTHLADRFKMRERFLTVNFRSGSLIVENAQWRAPLFQARPNAPLGVVEHIPDWDHTIFGEDTAVICRANAPLFSLAVYLLSNGKRPEFVGRDVIARIEKIMRACGKPATNTAQALANLDGVEEKKLRQMQHGKRGFQDMCSCVRVFLRQGAKLQDGLRLLEELANRAGDIKLMTAHKAKGLEFENVFFLDAHICKDEGQDPNIRYVIETRAINRLSYIRSDGRVQA